MTRRDIIIISVLANIAVLAVLFMLAFKTEEVKETEISPVVVNNRQHPIEEELVQSEPLDEVDLFIEGITPIHQELTLQMEEEQPEGEEVKEVAVARPATSADNVVDITVKSGDMLEKIARANGTTVEEIMKLNGLKSDKLRIGQVLKVPVRQAKPIAKQVEPPKPARQEATQYYTIKNGDNPWKIAKQFHLKVDDLLLMNNLDEDTARRLKAGDQIRIK